MRLNLMHTRYYLQAIAWVCLMGVPGVFDVNAAPPTEVKTQSTGKLKNSNTTSPQPGRWRAAANMAAARYGHTATLLKDGNVLVVGGVDKTGQLLGTELFDPVADGGHGAWMEMRSPKENRAEHTATLLRNGKVLIVGGATSTGIVATVELYDPAADGGKGSWTSMEPLKGVRRNHTATLLPNGKILIAGGIDNLDFSVGTELYDPTANQGLGASQLGEDLSIPTRLPTATLLPDGQVLTLGITSYEGDCSHNAALFTVSEVGELAEAGEDIDLCTPTATLLSNGKVLAIGVTTILLGDGMETAHTVASAGLYDSTAKSSSPKSAWSKIDPPKTARTHHTATLLANGTVLVVGGTELASDNGRYTGVRNVLASAEVYKPATNKHGGIWTGTSSMKVARSHHTATLLANGTVLVIGGLGGKSSSPHVLASAEIYEPAPVK